MLVIFLFVVQQSTQAILSCFSLKPPEPELSQKSLKYGSRAVFRTL